MFKKLIEEQEEKLKKVITSNNKIMERLEKIKGLEKTTDRVKEVQSKYECIKAKKLAKSQAEQYEFNELAASEKSNQKFTFGK